VSSSFKSVDLFGSGPHRFFYGTQGQHVVALRAFSDPSVPGSAAFGDLELEVFVRGRLVAASEAVLWTLRDAITAQSAFSAGSGTLIDHHGRSWSGMTLWSYEEEDRTDRGRLVSIGYEARFRKFIGS
jgi:hypothetical protein